MGVCPVRYVKDVLYEPSPVIMKGEPSCRTSALSPGFMVAFRASDFAIPRSMMAQRLGVSGHAKNMDDGSVEVVACGDAAQVEKLIKWLKEGGPRSARVDNILTEPHSPRETLTGFSIRY